MRRWSQVEIEELLAHIVEAWAAEILPEEPHAAAAATEAAVSAYTEGASVSEACYEARTLLGSWARHPSRQTRSSGRPRALIAS